MASSLIQYCLNWENIYIYFLFNRGQERATSVHLLLSESPETRKWLHIFSGCGKDCTAALKHCVCSYICSLLALWSSLKFKGSWSSGVYREPGEVKSRNCLGKPRTFYSVRVACFTNALALVSDLHNQSVILSAFGQMSWHIAFLVIW